MYHVQVVHPLRLLIATYVAVELADPRAVKPSKDSVGVVSTFSSMIMDMAE